MKTKISRPSFDKTVGVLVKAFLNDELAHKTCSGCAVGNIVAAAIGTRPKRDDDPNHVVEFDNNLFEDGSPAMGGWYSELYNPFYVNHDGEFQVRGTGYTREQLIQIEKAFEHAPGQPVGAGMWRGKCIDPEWMFNGLMAVVDALADIHGVDLSIKDQAKKLFVKTV